VGIELTDGDRKLVVVDRERSELGFHVKKI
jgi:hypothetical protein